MEPRDVFADVAFDAILEKGALDAVYLSGGGAGGGATEKRRRLDAAVSEMARVLQPGGICMSVSAACAEAVRESFDRTPKRWKTLRDGGFYLTADGTPSNNVDASILAWERL